MKKAMIVKSFLCVIFLPVVFLFSCSSNSIDKLLKELDASTKDDYVNEMIEQILDDDSAIQVKGMAKFTRCTTVAEELEKQKINMSVKQLEKYLLIVDNFSKISADIKRAQERKAAFFSDIPFVFPPSSPFVGSSPQFSIFSRIGTLRTKTKDTSPEYSLVIDMAIGYDLNDQKAETELVSRLSELRDFTINYFSNKYAADLSPEKEPGLKKDILEQLNSKVLKTAKAREIFFNQLDVMNM